MIIRFKHLTSVYLTDICTKMAAASTHVAEVSSNFVSTENMLRGSVYNCCTNFKDELQAFVSETKTVSEAIKILKDEHKPASATKSVPTLDSTCGGDSNLSSYQCCNCIQLESQLKESLNDLRSEKLLVVILNKEFTTLSHSFSTDSNANPTWATTKLSNFCARTTL
jgi:hypothetical protein